MTQEKFAEELETLTGFVEKYCKNRHSDRAFFTLHPRYGETAYSTEVEVCEGCRELISYALHKLQECPHEIKPRCRKCPTPCYDKKEWKQLAKIMKYNGVSSVIQKIIKWS